MLNRDLYVGSWNEALKMSEEPTLTLEELKSNSENALRAVYTSSAVSAVFATSLLSRELLSELTGRDLSEDDVLYDYIINSVEMTRDKALKWGLILMAQNGELKEALTEMFEMEKTV